MEQITAMVDGAVSQLHFTLVDVKVSQNKLNVYLDGENGDITLEECRTASRTLEALIETSGLFPEKYVLEVSSPGTRRPLRNAKEFGRIPGRTVSVTFTDETGKPATVTGKVMEVEDECVLLEEKKGTSRPIKYTDIANAKIKYVI